MPSLCALTSRERSTPTNLLLRLAIACSFCALLGASPAMAQEEEDLLPEWIEEFGYEDGTYGEWAEDAVFSSDSGSAASCDEPAAETGCDSLGGCDSICGCKGYDFWTTDKLTGDWGGHRTKLQKCCGITYRGRLTQYFFGVSGGVDPPVPALFVPLGIEGGDQFEYTGTSQHDFLIDLEKFGWLPHSKFVITLENIWGRFGNVSLESGAVTPPIFNAFMPDDIEAQGVPRVTNFLYAQPLSESFIFTVGKTRLVGVADQNIFAGGDGTDQFLNQAFVANPLFISQLPITTFVVSAIMPRKWGNIALSVIDPLDRSREFMEFDTLFSRGMILFGQVKFNTNFFCKPGEHHIGGIYKNVDLLDLAVTPIPPPYPYPPAPGNTTLATKPDTYTLFYGFDQYVSVYGKPDDRGNSKGWGIFGRAGLSDGATGNPNFYSWHVSGGIGGDTPIRHRRCKGDRFGIGCSFTATANGWGPVPTAAFAPRDSQAFEAYYKYRITPAVSVTPDVQWVRGQLGGLTGGDDAFVYGMRLNMVL